MCKRPRLSRDIVRGGIERDIMRVFTVIPTNRYQHNCEDVTDLPRSSETVLLNTINICHQMFGVLTR